jgi:hypothetical protein
MPITLSEIAVDRYYVTAKNQLRRIDKLSEDNQGRTRVHYSAKSLNRVRPGFWAAATKSNPALGTTFAKACAKRFSATEVAALRKRKLL